jgi:brefeldin A-resistance guanine nucleotide exchange factor 1
LKNILLVMANGKYLVSPSEDPSKEKLWHETRKRLERFLPHLFEEVFPAPSAEHQEMASKNAPSAGETAPSGEETGEGESR